MAEVNDALRGAAVGETRSFRKTFADDFPERRVQGQDRRLPGDARRAQGKEAAGARRRVRRRGGRGGHASRRCARRCATRLRHEKEADRERKFRRVILDGLLSRREIPAPEVLVESETDRGAARLRALPRAERRRPREGRLAEAADRGPPRGGEARPRVPAARRHRRRRKASRSPRRSSRPSSSGRPRSAASSPRSCGSRWPRRAASNPCATRCGCPGPSTS